MDSRTIPAARWPALRRLVKVRRFFRLFWPVAISVCLLVVAALMIVGVVLTVMGDRRGDTVTIGAIVTGLVFVGAGHYMEVFHA